MLQFSEYQGLPSVLTGVGWVPIDLGVKEREKSFGFSNVDCVRPLRSLANFKLNGISVSNVPFNLGFVNEEVVSLFLFDEAEALCLIEPFYCACCHYLDVRRHWYFK